MAATTNREYGAFWSSRVGAPHGHGSGMRRTGGGPAYAVRGEELIGRTPNGRPPSRGGAPPHLVESVKAAASASVNVSPSSPAGAPPSRGPAARTPNRPATRTQQPLRRTASATEAAPAATLPNGDSRQMLTTHRPIRRVGSESAATGSTGPRLPPLFAQNGAPGAPQAVLEDAVEHTPPVHATPSRRVKRGSPAPSSRARVVHAGMGSQLASSRANSESGPRLHGAQSLTGTYGLVGMGRKTNQDDFFVAEKRDGTILAGVMDGHGMDGQHVSGFVRQHLVNAFNEIKSEEDLQQATEHMRKAFVSANEQIKREAFDASESGTTAVAALCRGDEMVVANVGDSRCVLAHRDPSGRMRALPLTQDHKPDRPDEKARILRNNGAVEPIQTIQGKFAGPSRVWAARQRDGGLAVSRAIGDTNLNRVGVVPDPEIRRHKISRGDKFMVLASDGVFEHLDNETVVQIASKHTEAKKAADAVVSEARRRWRTNGGGYVDDITAVVVKIPTQ